jgi:hypothetical protein
MHVNPARKYFGTSQDITRYSFDIVQGSHKRYGNIHSDLGNFIQTLMYMWHMGCRWYTSDLHTQSPSTPSHGSTKACIPAYITSVSDCLQWVVKPCCLSASDANFLPARYFKKDPDRQKSLIQILPTRIVTSGSVLGRLRTTLPTYPDAHPMISISRDTIRNTWLAVSLQQMLTFCYTHGMYASTPEYSPLHQSV